MAKHSVFVFFYALIFCQTMFAQTSYSLTGALALTLLNNPELGTFSYDMRASDAKILQASLFPNPGFDAETENIDDSQFMQHTFLLSQLLEFGGKRKARINLAKAELNGVYLDYEVKKRQLFVETTLLFIDVLLNQQKLAFLEENLRKLEKFSPVIAKRLKIGKGTVAEEASFNVLLGTAYIDLQKVQSELKNAKYKLAAQWGDAHYDLFDVDGSLDWIPDLVSLEAMEGLLENHPQIMRYNIEREVREANIAVEKSKAFPDIAVRGGPRYLNESKKKWVWVVGAFVPLPINDRNQGRILESYELWEKLEKEKELIFVKLRTELNSAYTTLQAIYSELNTLKNFVLPSVIRANQFSYKGYQIGRFNYLELLETERSYKAATLNYLQAVGDYHKTLAQLEGLTGSQTIFIQECE